MAKEINTKIVLSINSKEIDGSFDGLKKTVKKFSDELRKLKPGTKEFIDKAAELKEVKEHFEKVKKEIDFVNGKTKEAKNSIYSYRNEIKQLTTELNKTEVGTVKFKQLSNQINSLKEKLNEAQTATKGLQVVVEETGTKSNRVFSFLRNSLFRLGDVAVGIFQTQVIGGFHNQLSKTTTELLKVSDAMADVQKTTGMALSEVKELWDEFDNFNTRTKKIDLLKIAEEGGRLNVPKEQMAAFVQEIDKVFVALGDSYEGGLQQIVGDIGKMKNLFKETNEQDYATAINGIGSALNELAANGVASEKNIAGFTLRVGALPDALKPSIDKVLGLGAAFEESGVDAQIAASGYSNFVKVAGENLQSFAYSMNISYAEAQKLFNENPEEFFLRFAEGMRGVPAEQTAKIFDSLKIGTLEVQKAVGAAANRTDEFRAAMARAGVAMEDANSLNDEFNKKNNNAAAIWEKIKNTISDTFTKTQVLEWFEVAIGVLGWFTGVTKEAGDGVTEFKNRLIVFSKIIITVITSLLSYKLALTVIALASKNVTQQTILYNLVVKTQTGITKVAKGVTYLFAAAKAKLTGNTIRATAAMRAFNIALKSNPWGVIASAVITLGTAFYAFYENTEKVTVKVKELRREQKLSADEQKAINKQMAHDVSELKNKVDPLVRILNDKNKSLIERKKAYQSLIQISPDFIGTVDKEYMATMRLGTAYGKLIDKIGTLAKKRAIESLTSEKHEELIKLEAENDVLQAEQQENLYKMSGILPGNKWAVVKNIPKLKPEEENKLINRNKEIDIKLNNNRKKIENLNQDIGNLNHTIKTRYADVYDDKKNDIITSNTIAPTSGGKTNRPAKDEASKKEQERKKDLEQSQSALEKARKEEIRIAQNLADEKLKILEENEDSEIKAQETAHHKEITNLKEQGNEMIKTIHELDEKLKNAKTDEAKKNYEDALNKEWEAVEKHNDLILQSEITHEKKISEIKSKYALQRHKKQVDEKQKEIELAFQKKETEIQNITSLEEAKKALLAQNHLVLTKEELRNIQTLEDAKKALREAAVREILAKEIAVMEEQKAKLKELLSDPKISPEALKKLREELEEVDSVLVRMKGQLQQKKGEDAQKAAQEENQRKKSIDILGFSAKDWEDMWANFDTTEGKIKGVIMATQALSNAFQRFARLQQALNEKEMKTFSKNQDEKKKKLLIQLNRGYISQEEYHKGIQKMEEETAEKKRQIQDRAARAEKAASLMSAIAGTASAVVGALGMKPWTPANFALAGIVGALGAVQVATIAAQPIPEFAEGGFTGLGSGKPDRTGFRPVGIVHENEYVTPKWMLQNPVVADVVDWMESIRTGRINLPKGYADGGHVINKHSNSEDTNNESLFSNHQPQTDYIVELIALLYDVKDFLLYLKENGVEAWMVEDAENGKRIKRTIKKFEKIENKNRIR
ncbi:phage tail tape measure protein [Bergeyella zoohelcum]|uniref:Phage tail tape measure protein, TP901 family, core region n=1 Tax=Bergeyella zoohelcum TaxID=1015 RepID=A0A376BZQ9_9FLAO|nr:phage tail tape measure protein [Bergeyella zoohelcum]EKB60793.1 hypothetical protein HMPREF9700_00288 [Bergeyella zoohelcum CCUG 30536]SSZ47116.1 phage tail tape measure protein, TP901 family, core region [Bergeyella zoohelcum]